MALAELVCDLKVDNLHKVVQNGRQKYLCFTRFNKEGKFLMVEVTDGLDLWILEVDDDDNETQKDLNNVTGTDTFLTKIRNGFISGDISVGRVGSKLTLTLGKGGSTISLDLFEARAAEKKNELQSILFRMAESCAHAETQLSAANQQIEQLKIQKSSPSKGLGALMDLSPQKGSGASKAKPSKVGMSVVNPSSRKRKAAAGVVFGE